MLRSLLKKPKVHRAVSDIIGFISHNSLKEGSKLPPIRDLAQALNVSTYTVHSGLNELKKLGILGNIGKKAIYLKNHPPRDLQEYISENAEKRKVTLYYRDSFDIRKLGSVLLRRKFNNLFMDKFRDINIEEVQLDEPVLDFEACIIKNLFMNSPEPTGWETTLTSLPFYLKQNLIAPLQSKTILEHSSSIRKECVEKVSDNREMFMLPLSRSLSYIIYNKDIFATSGLGRETFGNWNCFEDGLEILQKNGFQTPFMLNDGVETAFILQHWIIQQMEHKADGTPKRLAWQGKEADAALEYFHRLAFGKKLLSLKNISTEDRLIGLLTNKIPFTYALGEMAGALLQSKEAERFGIAFIPALNNGRQVSLGNIRGSVINRHAAPENTDAYIEYLKTREEWIHFQNGATEYRSANRYPSPFSIFSDEANDRFTAAATPMPDDWRKAFAELEEKMVWEPAGSSWERVLLGEIIESIMNSDGIGGFREMKNFFNMTYEIKYSGSVMQLFNGIDNKGE